MSDETHETQDATQEPQDEVAVAQYGTSARTRYILIALIVILAFALSYGIAQARSASGTQPVANQETPVVADTASLAASAGGG
jgi:hypothetical protein